MRVCPHCHASVPDASMRFCGQCGAKLDRGAEVLPLPLRTEADVRREREERTRRTIGIVFAVLWLVLPITGGCIAAANGASFWVGFFIGAIANGILSFLHNPFGL